MLPIPLTLRLFAAAAGGLSYLFHLLRKRETKFYVIGNVYKDTTWKEIVPGTEQVYGPFDTHEQAKNVWQGKAWLTVDNALMRFKIEER